MHIIAPESEEPAAPKGMWIMPLLPLKRQVLKGIYLSEIKLKSKYIKLSLNAGLEGEMFKYEKYILNENIYGKIG